MIVDTKEQNIMEQNGPNPLNHDLFSIPNI
jgi:hypothetical protein